MTSRKGAGGCRQTGGLTWDACQKSAQATHLNRVTIRGWFDSLIFAPHYGALSMLITSTRARNNLATSEYTFHDGDCVAWGLIWPRDCGIFRSDAGWSCISGLRVEGKADPCTNRDWDFASIIHILRGTMSHQYAAVRPNQPQAAIATPERTRNIALRGTSSSQHT